MTKFFHPLFVFFLHIGYFGPLLLGVLDSSFFFLPIGNDILVILLIANHHRGFPWYVLMAATGSTIGIFFLDLVARKLGEAGIEKMAGKKRFEMLKRKVGSRGGLAVVIASLVPPPFPYLVIVATVSALEYPRARLLISNWFGRAIRYTIIGILAIEFGSQVISVAKSDAFVYSVLGFAILCLAGSAFSIWNWVRHLSHARKNPRSTGLMGSARQ